MTVGGDPEAVPPPGPRPGALLHRTTTIVGSPVRLVKEFFVQCTIGFGGGAAIF
jgi:hypothetical protein